MRMIALDLGSTFTKAALLTAGKVQAERQIPTPTALLKDPDRYEIDAEVYYRQVVSLIDAFMDDMPIDGILFSTQMHGYILTDAAMKPITPYISWQDKLGAKHLPAIREFLMDVDVYPSGVPLKGNLAVCSLLARRAEGEEIPEGAYFHTLGGYIIARLTGRHACHITNAAPTGLADVQSGCWNEVLLKRTGLFMLRMPEIVDSIKPVGLYRGIKVYPDIGDQQVCAFGAGLEVEHSLHVNVGTAGLLGALCQEFKVDRCESRPWLEKGCYLRTVSGLLGGRYIQALRETYRGSDDEVWPLLTQTPDAHASAVYQEVADNYREAAERMEFQVGELCYTGGCVLKNPAFRACIETAFGISKDRCIHTSDIWTGMIRLASKIETDRVDTNERIME